MRLERKLQDMKKPVMFIMIMEMELLFSDMDPISDTGILEQSGMVMKSGTEAKIKIITEMEQLIRLIC